MQGLLADTHGIRAVTVAGALALLAVCVLVAVLRPTAFTHLADPAPPGDVGAPGMSDAPGPAPTGGTA
jgi:hypothetical protein